MSPIQCLQLCVRKPVSFCCLHFPHGTSDFKKEKKKIYIISRLYPLQPIWVTVIGSIAKLSEFQFQLYYFLTM